MFQQRPPPNGAEMLEDPSDCEITWLNHQILPQHGSMGAGFSPEQTFWESVKFKARRWGLDLSSRLLSLSTSGAQRFYCEF